MSGISNRGEVKAEAVGQFLLKSHHVYFFLSLFFNLFLSKKMYYSNYVNKILIIYQHYSWIYYIQYLFFFPLQKSELDRYASKEFHNSTECLCTSSHPPGNSDKGDQNEILYYIPGPHQKKQEYIENEYLACCSVSIQNTEEYELKDHSPTKPVALLDKKEHTKYDQLEIKTSNTHFNAHFDPKETPANISMHPTPLQDTKDMKSGQFESASGLYFDFSRFDDVHLTGSEQLLSLELEVSDTHTEETISSVQQHNGQEAKDNDSIGGFHQQLRMNQVHCTMETTTPNYNSYYLKADTNSIESYINLTDDDSDLTCACRFHTQLRKNQEYCPMGTTPPMCDAPYLSE